MLLLVSSLNLRLTEWKQKIVLNWMANRLLKHHESVGNRESSVPSSNSTKVWNISSCWPDVWSFILNLCGFMLRFPACMLHFCFSTEYLKMSVTSQFSIWLLTNYVYCCFFGHILLLHPRTKSLHFSPDSTSTSPRRIFSLSMWEWLGQFWTSTDCCLFISRMFLWLFVGPCEDCFSLLEKTKNI